MDRNAISNLRLSNQQIINSKFDNPIELLEWMGAVQAQDLPMAMLAIAMRVRNATVKNIEQAFKTDN